MKIICPNFKNKEVAAEFEELKNATSENAAYHIWSQNNGNGIDKAPNGEPSKLFSDLLEYYNGDRVAAIQAKARTYSKSFKEWFGESKVVDENGEPLIVYSGRPTKGTTTFNLESKRSRTHLTNLIKKGVYFTKDKQIAEMYSGSRDYASQLDRDMAKYGFGEDGGALSMTKEEFLENFPDVTSQYYDEMMEKYNRVVNDPDNFTGEFFVSKIVIEGEVIPAFLNLRNATTVDMQGSTIAHLSKEQKESINNSEGAIIENVDENASGIILTSGITTTYVAFNPNQIKSIDNQGTFSTQDNNIYHQESTVSETPSGRNQKLQELLSKLYPNISVSEFNDSNLRGQAIVQSNMAGEVLINSALENEDTLPHEYAHHYIAWFRNAPIVQKAIKAFGTEEKLVQAIGKNTVKATKWYNNIWNYIKGLFNKKQKLLNDLTNDFMSNTDLENPYEVLDTEYHYQTVEKDDAPDQILKVYEGLKKDIQVRIKDLMHYKVLDNRKIDQLNNQFSNLDKMEADEAVFEYINYIEPDIEVAKDRIEAMEAKVKNALINGKPIDLDIEQLVDLKKGFLGFYNAAITNILNMLDDYTVEQYINDPELLKRLKLRMEAIKSDYATIDRKYRLIAADVAKQLIIDYATKKGSTSINDLKKKISTTDTDLNWFELYLGSPVYAKDEILRIVADKLQNGKSLVAEITNAKGKEIVDTWKKVKKSDLKYLREVDKKGKTTGYLTRDLNFGQKNQDFQEFKAKLAEKYNLDDTKKVPETLSELRKYRREINKWKAAHVERRFVPEYYELFDSLSDEAVAARDKYQEEINYLLSKVRDKEGNYHKEEMTDEDYERYERAVKAKQNLSNLYNEDGTLKEGIEKQIALELKEVNRRLNKNLNYKQNEQKFMKSLQDAQKKGKEKFSKWLQRNTVIKVDEEFYEELDKVTNPYTKSENTITLEEQRRELLKLYRMENGNIDAENIPMSVREQIAELDKLISESRAKDKKEQAIAASGAFSSMAYIWVNPEYYTEWDKAAERGDEYFEQWKKANTYDAGFGLQPASFWTKIMPLNNKYLTRYPNKEWYEVDKDSKYYNQNFDDSYGETEVPKRALYDNTQAYRKITNNKNLHKLYNQLIDLKIEADEENLPFLKYANAFRLPQIEGGAYRIIVSQDSLLKGLGYLYKDVVTLKDDDTSYLRDVARRSDGSIVNLVPTRFIKQLEDPAAITRDTVGSYIKYYEMSVNYKVMSALAPELELIQQQVGERTFESEEKGTQFGYNTRTYQKLSKILDMNLWGKEKNLLSFEIGGKKIILNKLFDGIVSYTRILGISQNLNVILTGLFTNKLQNLLEAISGYYFDYDDLRKASKEVAMSYLTVAKSIGSPDSKSKIVALMELAGVGRSVSENFTEMQRSKVMRTLIKHYFYFGHEIVDYATKGKMLVATYMAHKYNPDTNSFVRKNEFIRGFNGSKKQAKLAWNRLTTTLYDAYELKDGVLQIKDKYRAIISRNLEDQVRNTARTIATRIDGQLSDIDKSLIHASTFGQFLTIFRNFLIVNYQTRFGTAPQFNYSTGRYVRSYNRAALDYALDKTKLADLLSRWGYNKKYIEQLHQMSFGYEEMKDFEKAAFRRVLSETIIGFFVLGLITMAINKMADDDKDNWFLNELAYLLGRTKLETRSNLSPYEWFSILNSPTAATNTLTGVVDLFTTFFDDPFADIRKGPYKGMKRYQRSIIKMTPIKFYYEAKDPRSKREYLEHQLLN